MIFGGEWWLHEAQGKLLVAGDVLHLLLLGGSGNDRLVTHQAAYTYDLCTLLYACYILILKVDYCYC